MNDSRFENSALHPAEHLGLLKKGQCATVAAIVAGDSAEERGIATRLLELGFAPGERIQVVARSFPGGDPVAVRLGNTTFALRRHEAVMIRVTGCTLASL